MLIGSAFGYHGCSYQVKVTKIFVLYFLLALSQNLSYKAKMRERVSLEIPPRYFKASVPLLNESDLQPKYVGT